jgi:hypothetical protein
MPDTTKYTRDHIATQSEYPNFYEDNWAAYDTRRLDKVQSSIEPLIRHLRHYDRQRLKLQTEGGDVRDLIRLTETLTREIPIYVHGYHTTTVSLSKPRGIARALREIHFDLCFDVCLLGNEMPAYYICRTYGDHWSLYSLIVQDLYKSPGYPKADRFVKLMRCGHEEYFLRLSSFRNKLSAMKQYDTSTEMEKDGLLYDVGRYIFEAAWHEDQQIGMLAADSLDMPNLRHAIELIYLCASGELCELRNAIAKHTALVDFFRTVYSQPAICTFLEEIKDLPGDTLCQYQKRAVKCYRLLSQAFGKFLSETQIRWGMRSVTVPIYKILFANISRIHNVSKLLKRNGGTDLEKAITALNNYAKEIIATFCRP